MADVQEVSAPDFIQVVDFNALKLGQEQPNLQSSQVQKIAKQIYEAFTTSGFVYLKNHGVPQSMIEQLWSAADSFFTLPVDVKMKYRRPEKGEGDDGWAGLEREKPNPEQPYGDYKETFNYGGLGSSQSMHVEEVPVFIPRITEAYHTFTKLSNIILDVLGVGLGLEDPEILKKFHTFSSSQENPSTIRLVYYPMIGPDVQLKPGQMRCTEHSDFGSITLLWQESKGLQVQTLSGEYILAPPLPGTVLVNIADLMQRWTSDKLIAAKHRVLISEEDIKHPKVRKALAFFVHPDNSVLVECLDGSNKYPPINAKDYLVQGLNALY